MKKTVLLGFLFLFCTSFLFAASLPTTSRSVLISSHTTFPAAPQPGDQVSLSLTLENASWGYLVRDINVTLNLPTEFGVTPAYAYVDVLDRGSKTTVAFNFTFPDHTYPGSYVVPIELNYLSNGIPISVEKSIPITLTQNPELDIKHISITPATATPGDSVRISATVANVGKFTAKDVILSLEQFSKTSTALTELYSKDVLFDKDMSVHLGPIAPGAEREITFTLTIDEDAIPSIIPFVLVAKASNTSSETEPISIKVDGTVDLALSAVSFDKHTIYDTDTLSVSAEVENLGKKDAKLVRFDVTSDDPNIAVPDSVYLGGIDADDTSTGVIDISLHNAKVGKHKLTLLLRHKDANEPQEYYITFFVEKSPPKPPWDLYGFIIVLTAIIFLGVRSILRHRAIAKI